MVSVEERLFEFIMSSNGVVRTNNLPDALVMRNICGHIAPILNDIVALDVFLGLSDIMVVHHTGMLHPYSSAPNTNQA